MQYKKSSVLKKTVFAFLMVLLAGMASFTTKGDNGGYSFFSLSEYGQEGKKIPKVSRVIAVYDYTFKGETNKEEMTYTFDYDGQGKLSGIRIDEFSEGPLGKFNYFMIINNKLEPEIIDFHYDAYLENASGYVRYEYYDDKIIFKNLGENSEKSLSKDNRITADSLYLMEYMTFAALEEHPEIHSTSYHIFSAFKIPFYFKVTGRENVITPNGYSYDAYRVEANASGFLGFLSSITGNKGLFLVRKDFPHIRIYAEYADKTYWLTDCQIFYKQ